MTLWDLLRDPVTLPYWLVLCFVIPVLLGLAVLIGYGLSGLTWKTFILRTYFIVMLLVPHLAIYCCLVANEAETRYYVGWHGTYTAIVIVVTLGLILDRAAADRKAAEEAEKRLR